MGLAVALGVAVSSLTWVTAGGAHVVATPSFVATGGTSTLGLVGPNEREEPMTEFAVTVPAGLEIAHAHADGWEAEFESSTATWTRGALAPAEEETFEVRLRVSAAPGPITLGAEQRYPGGEVVAWDVPLTVVPATTDDPEQNVGWALAVAAVGLLVAIAVVLLAWRRRARALQER